uniref:Activin_recp domain-containing protein n=1 Tax=Parastrongyloides trichosuri TaxID=131310 RepID=A0A0N5A6E5_PARTI
MIFNKIASLTVLVIVLGFLSQEFSALTCKIIDFNSKGLTDTNYIIEYENNERYYEINSGCAKKDMNCDPFGKTFCYTNYIIEYENNERYYEINSGCAKECLNPQPSCNASSLSADNYDCCCQGEQCNKLF